MPDLPEELQQWRGVTTPRYTPLPDELLDLWMAHLTESEWKVLCYICRRTFGFKKDADQISLEQIATGIVRHDGRRLDYGTGLARKSVQRGVSGLLAKGLITQQYTTDAAGRDRAPLYSLRWQDGQFDAPGRADADNLSSVGASQSRPQETDESTYRNGSNGNERGLLESLVRTQWRKVTPRELETIAAAWHASKQPAAAWWDAQARARLMAGDLARWLAQLGEG